MKSLKNAPNNFHNSFVVCDNYKFHPFQAPTNIQHIKSSLYHVFQRKELVANLAFDNGANKGFPPSLLLIKIYNGKKQATTNLEKPHGQHLKLGGIKVGLGKGVIEGVSSQPKVILYGGAGEDLWSQLIQPFLENINKGSRYDGVR